MRDVAFGQYYPTKSVIHNLDARAKIIFSITFMICIFFCQSYATLLAAFIFITVLVILAKVPFRLIIKSIKPIIFLILFTMILNLFFYKKTEGDVLYIVGNNTIIFSLEGIDISIKVVLRLIALVLGTAVLTLTTTPTQLTDALESLLKPLKYLKVPVHDLAIIMSIALRFIPGFIDETDKIIKAQKSRGANFDTGKLHERIKAVVPILIPLFVNAFMKADELADALDSRCYNATEKRTKMKVLHFSYRDLVALLVFATLITFFIVDFAYLHLNTKMEDVATKILYDIRWGR